MADIEAEQAAQRLEADDAATDLREMLLHETAEYEDFWLVRVIGGWIYRVQDGSAGVFVPEPPT
jgi:hypothetical protein